jgi:hypothetical protein
MGKRSSASTPSWRTLSRKAKAAEYAGDKKLATKLRAQVSAMRKGSRATSPSKTAPHSEVVFGLDADAAAYREDAAAALSQALSEAQRVRENMSIRIVCGFIAEVLANEAQHGGLSPETTFNISSFTVLKIVEALKEAGYSPHGKTPF